MTDTVRLLEVHLIEDGKLQEGMTVGRAEIGRMRLHSDSVEVHETDSFRMVTNI